MAKIDYKQLFDFEGYNSEIDKSSQVSKEFAEAIALISASLKMSANELKVFLKELKTNFESLDVNQKGFAENAIKFVKVVDEQGQGINNLSTATENFEVAVESVNGSVNGLKQKIKTLTDEYNNLDPAIESDKVRMEELRKEIAQAKVDHDNLTKSVKETTKEIKTANGSYNALQRRLSELREQLKNMPGAINEMTGELDMANPAVKELVSNIQKTDQTLKSADAAIGQYTRNVGNYKDTNISLKKELREVTQQMMQLRSEGKENSVEYQNLSKKAGELKLIISDVSEEVKNAGAKFQNIRGSIDIMGGIAGAASVAEGAMALVGVQNETVEESIKKLVAITNIMNGIQQVANMLDQESAAIIMVTSAQKKIQVLVTQLQGAAESKNIIIRKAATAAQWLLNKAMLANPAGILIAVVALLAGAVLLLTKNTNKAVEQQKRLNEVMELGIEVMKRSQERMNNNIKVQQEAQDKQERRLQRELELMKVKLASDEDLYNKQSQLDAKRVKNAEAVLKAVEKQTSKILGQYNLLANSKAGSSFGLFAANDLQTARDSIQKSITSKQRLITNLQVNTPGATKQLDIQKQSLEALQNQYTIIDNQIKNLEKAGIDAGKTLYEQSANDFTGKRKLQEDYLKFQINSIQTELQKSKEGSELEYQEKLKLIEKEKNLELFNARTKGERDLINAKAERESYEFTKDYKFKVAQSELNSKISITNAELNEVKVGTNEELLLKKNLSDQSAQLEVLGVENSIFNEEEKQSKIKAIYTQALKDKKDLEWEKRKAEDDAHEKSISAARDLEKIRAQITISDPSSSRSDVKKAKVILKPENDLAAIDAEIQRTKDLKDIKFKTELEYQDRLDELTKEREQKRLEIILANTDKEKEIRSSVIDIVSQGLEGLLEIQNANSQDNINRVQNESNQRLKIIENNRNLELKKVEGDKEKELAAEAKYNEQQFQEERRTQKRLNQEKKRQARIERDESLWKVGLSTAVAVAKAISESPITFGLPWSAFAAAQGIVQAGLIMAKPLPAYKMGIKSAPEGPAIVNDESGQTFKEMIVSRGKAFIPEKRNQVVYLNKGDRVINAFETQNILKDAEKNIQINRIVEQSNLHGKLAFKLQNDVNDISKRNMSEVLASNTASLSVSIGKEFRESLSELPIEQHIWDEIGYHRRIKTKNNTIEKLNSRHSL